LYFIDQQSGVVLQQPDISLLATVEWHAHLPWSGEYCRVINGHLVVDVIGTGKSETFDQVQRVAVEIPGAIEPCLICKVHNIDNEGIARPMSARVSHPPVDRSWRMLASVGIDGTDAARVLKGDHHV